MSARNCMCMYVYMCAGAADAAFAAERFAADRTYDYIAAGSMKLGFFVVVPESRVTFHSKSVKSDYG